MVETEEKNKEISKKKKKRYCAVRMYSAYFPTPVIDIVIGLH
jgi:hypothetical protein